MPGPAAPEPMSEPNPTHGSPAASSSELQINIDQSERDTLMNQGYQTYPRAQELDTLHKKVNDLEMEKTLLAEENQKAKRYVTDSVSFEHWSIIELLFKIIMIDRLCKV